MSGRWVLKENESDMVHSSTRVVWEGIKKDIFTKGPLKPSSATM